jgi:colicin import membrane protein
MNALAGGLFAPRRSPNLVAGLLALGVHVAFVLLLVFGVSWQTRHPAPMMVDIWQSLPKAAPHSTPPPVQPSVHRQTKVTRHVSKPPPLPDRRDADIALEKKKAETARLKKLKAELAAKEKEKADAAREKLQAEQKKSALLRQMAAEDMKQSMAAEVAADQARLAKLAEAQARQAAAKQAAAQARAAADALQAEGARTVGRYRDMISAKVRGNTRLPENLKGNPEVRCLVKLLPTGEVLSVRVTQSSGNPEYAPAVVRAIEKSSPLPLPSDRLARAEFVPELTFVHRPKE